MDKISPYSGELYEGPIWVKDSLYWVDILKGEIHRLKGKEYKKIVLENYVSSIQPHVNGNIIATSGHGFYSINFEKNDIHKIFEVKDWDSRNRFNDGKCDALGRYWIGTMNLEEKYPTGGLFVLDLNKNYKKVLDGTTISNGLAWSSDNKKFYFIDSPTKKVFSFDFNINEGYLSNRVVAIDLSKYNGNPDGMTIDSEGKLWVALFGGKKVLRCDPNNGDILDEVELPTPNVTSVTFGGDNLNILYITTAKIHLKEPDKNAGYLYYEKTNYKGTGTNYCKI